MRTPAGARPAAGSSSAAPGAGRGDDARAPTSVPCPGPVTRAAGSSFEPCNDRLARWELRERVVRRRRSSAGKASTSNRPARPRRTADRPAHHGAGRAVPEAPARDGAAGPGDRQRQRSPSGRAGAASPAAASRRRARRPPTTIIAPAAIDCTARTGTSQMVPARRSRSVPRRPPPSRTCASRA